MAAPISLGHPTPPPQKNENNSKSAFAKRFSFQIDATQALTIVAIAAVLFMPLVAAAIAPAMPATQVQPFNATCPPLPIGPVALAAYLRAGSGGVPSSPAAIKADRLQLEDFAVNSWETADIKQLRLENEKFKLLKEAAEEYLEKAEQEDHPAARALAFHQAKDALHQARALLKRRWDRGLEDKVKDLRIKEADACQEAAEWAEAPEEKLEWVARGLEELQISLNPQLSLSYLLTEDRPKCDIAVSLWTTAAKAFRQFSPRENNHFLIISPPHWEAPFSGTQFAAAQSLLNAGYCTKLLGNDEEAHSFYEEAIEVLKEIDTASCSLKMQTALQEEIVGACISVWNFLQWKEHTPAGKLKLLAARAFSEAMIVQKLYQQLILESSPYMASLYTIKRAIRLEDAAYFSPNLTENVELYREARDSVQKVWDENRAAYWYMEAFTASNSLEHGLLPRLKRETHEAEQKLLKENLKPTWNMLAALWNTFRNLVKSKET